MAGTVPGLEFNRRSGCSQDFCNPEILLDENRPDTQCICGEADERSEVVAMLA
ncbi:hypothetical protein MLAC_31000 [Mycobacterium lacus]|uniref:Uncharacterized protein n=1 Tax=Mycobacterium lacus TaxID=169765 RepID=A0A7I7NMC8_9MYCO|nr:hypothetical protein MLAC_31000 [Mycobacterium lacus]